MDEIRVERTVPLRSSPDALWPLLSNTDRLNRALGLPAHERDPLPSPDFARMVTARVFGPLTLRWLERPFDYTRERFYRNVREFVGGPIARFEGGVRLEPAAGGWNAVVDGNFTPRWAATAPLLRLAAAKAVDDMARLVEKFDGMIAGGGFAATARVVTPPNEALLSARAADLLASGADKRAAERLIELLRAAPDDEIGRLRPYELADRWSLPREAVLGACLHAVRAGLLDLRWDVLCPNCAAPPETLGSLSEVRASAHCPSCAIDFSTSGAESVELRFAAHPSVRAASGSTYCAGSPAHSRHVAAQASLSPGAPKTVEIELGAQSYVVRGMRSRRIAVLRPRAGGDAEFALDLDALEDGAERFFKPGLVRLRLSAQAGELARVEPEEWRQAAATAGAVTALPDFRRLFSAEVLSPGMRVGVKRLALLFTDLKGSTALYERVGDAAAYALVREHFDYLYALVAARGGAVVKTIGDAVMAVFPDAAGALEAALDMQEGLAALNARLSPRPPIVLKVGLHEGSAIAIGAGGTNDYFGTTANVAARVQNESEGGDVIVSDAVMSDPAAAAVVERRGPSREEFRRELKGLSTSFRLWRLRQKVS
jgi:class 3 adenylate cyclase